MSGVGRFIRKRRATRAAFMADPAISIYGRTGHARPSGHVFGLESAV